MRKHLLTAAGVVAAAVLGAAPGHATLIISGDVGGTVFTCTDNNACDLNPVAGTIELPNFAVNGVQVNGSLQTSTGTPANPGSNVLNTSSLSVINNSGADRAITVAVGDTDFLGPVSSFVSAGSGVFQDADGSTVTLNWFNDPANQQGAEDANDTPGTLIDTFTHAAVGAADSFSHNGGGTVSDDALFSMTEQITGLLVDGGQLLNRGQTEIKLTEIPEPSTLAVFGMGLLATAALQWRRRRDGMSELTA